MRHHPDTRPEDLDPPADTPGLRAALALLLQTHGQAERERKSPWEFAVPWNVLRSVGQTAAELARLLARGRVEHRPAPRAEDACPFRPRPRSLLVLTADGLRYARLQVGSMRPGDGDNPTPFWEGPRGGLWFRGAPVAYFRDDAVRLHHLLAGFQRQNWQRCIDNPFRGDEGVANPKVALHKAIERVNVVTKPAGLRFRGSGTGGACWEGYRMNERG
jgi:hypothetical protein